ncbi:uncharacterized protein LOC134983580 [Pseudophryne corroboree]|uniref:uncharacterized protein LOC134944592 n=2 Tax=Pseudophryne corroboree TaxID=495146 RepID=UPI003081E45E
MELTNGNVFGISDDDMITYLSHTDTHLYQPLKRPVDQGLRRREPHGLECANGSDVEMIQKSYPTYSESPKSQNSYSPNRPCVETNFEKYMRGEQWRPMPSQESESPAEFSIDTFDENLFNMDQNGYCCILTDDEMIEEADRRTSTPDTTTHSTDDKENQHRHLPNRHLRLADSKPLIMNQVYSTMDPRSRVSGVPRTTHWVNEKPKHRGVKRKLEYNDKTVPKRRRLTAVQEVPISCNINKFKMLPDQNDDDEQMNCVSAKTVDTEIAKGKRVNRLSKKYKIRHTKENRVIITSVIQNDPIIIPDTPVEPIIIPDTPVETIIIPDTQVDPIILPDTQVDPVINTDVVYDLLQDAQPLYISDVEAVDNHECVDISDVPNKEVRASVVESRSAATDDVVAGPSGIDDRQQQRPLRLRTMDVNDDCPLGVGSTGMGGNRQNATCKPTRAEIASKASELKYNALIGSIWRETAYTNHASTGLLTQLSEIMHSGKRDQRALNKLIKRYLGIAVERSNLVRETCDFLEDNSFGKKTSK